MLALELSWEEAAEGLRVAQPRRGYRYAMDPYLLAGWLGERGLPEDFIELGTGCGVLALLLARRGLRGRAVEAEPAWAELARRSVEASGMVHRVEVIEEDIRRWRPARGASLALANPPYFPLGRGPLPPDPLKAAARFETRGDLGDWVRALAALAPRVALVLPARREAELRELLAAHGRPLRRLCRLRTARGRDLALVEGEESAAEPLLEELQLQLADGQHHPRVRQWYEWLGAPLRPGAG